MKCPDCGYLAFNEKEACPKCGKTMFGAPTSDQTSGSTAAETLEESADISTVAPPPPPPPPPPEKKTGRGKKIKPVPVQLSIAGAEPTDEGRKEENEPDSVSDSKDDESQSRSLMMDPPSDESQVGDDTLARHEIDMRSGLFELDTQDFDSLVGAGSSPPPPTGETLATKSQSDSKKSQTAETAKTAETAETVETNLEQSENGSPEAEGATAESASEKSQATGAGPGAEQVGPADGPRSGRDSTIDRSLSASFIDSEDESVIDQTSTANPAATHSPKKVFNSDGSWSLGTDSKAETDPAGSEDRTAAPPAEPAKPAAEDITGITEGTSSFTPLAREEISLVDGSVSQSKSIGAATATGAADSLPTAQTAQTEQSAQTEHPGETADAAQIESDPEETGAAGEATPGAEDSRIAHGDRARQAEARFNTADTATGTGWGSLTSKSETTETYGTYSKSWSDIYSSEHGFDYFISRFAAGLVDAFVMLSVYSIFAVSALLASGVDFYDLIDLQTDQLRDLAAGSGAPFFITAMVVGLLYSVTFTSAIGATPGKLMMGLKVLQTGGGRLGPGRAFIRWVARLAGLIFLGLPYLPAFFDDRARALHDRLADSMVVETEDEQPPKIN